MKKVLIGGGSGLVGSRLTQMLEEKGYVVTLLSRKQSEEGKIIQWDLEKMTLDAETLADYDFIIQLAGSGIAEKAWTPTRKKDILDSRVKPTQLLAKAIASQQTKPTKFISASAVGYYGFNTSEKIYTEQDEAGKDFLGEVCQQWEEEINQVQAPTATVRIGIVLSKNGGALKEMAKPFHWGFGAALGSGKQYIPWIHIDDLCRLFIHLIEKEDLGVYNAASPNQHNNKTFSTILAKVLKKPMWLPNVPAFVLAAILGKRKALVLEGSRVSVQKLLDTGFVFKFPNLEEALKDIYS